MVNKSNAARKAAPQSTVDLTKKTDAPKVIYPTTQEMIDKGLVTKSARIRHLHSLGMTTGDIARQETNGLYQHAFNVIKKPLKKVAAPAPAASAPTVTPEALITPEA